MLWAFVAGFLFAPCFHTYNHKDDHVHDASAHLLAHSQGHAHAHVPSPVRASRREAPLGAAASPSVEADPRQQHLPPHGRDALEHFGVALTSTSQFVLVRVVQPITQLAPLGPSVTAPLRSRESPHQPRGPPVAIDRGPEHRC